MELFRQGESARASKLQDEFLAEIKQSGLDHCTCPATCKFHGKCVECVTLHRGHGDRLPHCLQNMVNRELATLGPDRTQFRAATERVLSEFRHRRVARHRVERERFHRSE